ncbi:MAG: plasmid partitioning protein [Pseudomonadota bacterium]|nr:plasmid partitioning protein [Pseudomonadota bacterium]
MRILSLLSGLPLIALALCAGSYSPPAAADRCTQGANGWSCTHQKRYNYYWCNFAYVPRAVRWQVPEGTPPAGGWPVAFYYAGTQPSDLKHAFKRDYGDSFGTEYEPQIMHELLDDPYQTGKKYAVMVADPPASGGWVQAWHTNLVVPYSASCDADFFPDFFGEIKGGSYGAASQYNMNKRYAFGISSGGFNSSRMAVTFNSGSGNANTWKALGILAASYATCSYSCGSIPALPANHPPTKFWHGQNDPLVPLTTMYSYYTLLSSGGFTTQKLEHPGGHEFTVDNIGASGIKAWFDQY